MDPLSIATGALAVVEITGIVTKKLIELKAAYKRFDSELEGLIKVLNGLDRTLRSAAGFCEDNEASLLHPSGVAKQQIADIIENVRGFFIEADDLVNDLQFLINEIQGDSGVQHRFEKLEKFRRVLRREKREDEMNDIWLRICDCYNAIQVSMTALNIAAVQAAKDSTNASIEGAEERITDDISRLKLELLSKLAQFGDRVAEKASAAANISGDLQGNQFFEMSQTVTSYFTGREELLKELRTAFRVNDLNSEPDQRRFVISGVAGSGKSQFASRFAADVRKYFWGVFSVDASSPASAENDFSKIARCSDRGATTMKAAMEWLASRRTPWLLILDNADQVNVEDYFPGGSYGCILATTRNPALQALGTAGRGFFHFNELKRADAQKLLLRAAGVKIPCTEQTILEAANQISEKMCYLPLALNYAGMTIRQRLCDWADYLSWYERQQKKSALIKRQKTTTFGRPSWAVFHNFEALLTHMEHVAETHPDPERARSLRDALDLLNLFAFFHYRDIRLDMLLQCIENPQKEKQLYASSESPTPRPGARATVKKRLVDAVEWARAQGFHRKLFVPPLVLPPILRDYCDARDDERLEAKFRIQSALSELASRSLISDPGETWAFSVYPLIHSFCRDRLGDANEGIWCEAAEIALARCVVIEEKLFAGGKSDFFNARQLLPHVDYCRGAGKKLRTRFKSKSEARGLLGRTLASRPSSEDSPPPNDPARWIRFSIVYFQCGKAKECYRLQKPIRDMSVATRGIDHDISIRLSLATAITKQWLGDFRECVSLQREAVNGCIELYGNDHPTTLKNDYNMGRMLLAAGRLNEASKSLRRAHEGLLKHADRGAAHKDTLNAMSHVGLLEVRYFRPEKARDLCEKAVKGLANCSDAGTDLLNAKETLALALTHLGGGHLEEAHRLQEEVLSTRVKQQGRENLSALLARLNMSRVLLAKGEYHGAEMLLLWGIEVGIRDFTEEHYGVLAAQSLLARVYDAQGKSDKAEKKFDHVNRKLKILWGRHGYDHVDRILNLWYFLQFYEGQERWEEALDIHSELLLAVETVDNSYTKEKLGKNHKMHQMLLEKQPQLVKALNAQKLIRSKTEPSRHGAPSDGKDNVRAASDAELSITSDTPTPPPAYDDSYFTRMISVEKRGREPQTFRRVRTDPSY